MTPLKTLQLFSTAFCLVSDKHEDIQHSTYFLSLCFMLGITSLLGAVEMSLYTRQINPLSS